MASNVRYQVIVDGKVVLQDASRDNAEAEFTALAENESSWTDEVQLVKFQVLGQAKRGVQVELNRRGPRAKKPGSAKG